MIIYIGQSKMPKSSNFSRTSKLLGLASKVAAKELGLKITQAVKSVAEHETTKTLIRTQQAQLITKNLSQLKGAAMKAGQLLSIDSSQILPPEASEILSKLQSMAEPEDFKNMQPIIVSELGETFNELSYFDEEAFAAASIGQVHKATYNGNQLAIKIQYPNISESIDSDLQALKKLTQIILLPTNKKIDLNDTFIELAEVLKLEADYIHEAEVLSYVHDQMINDDFFYAPKVYKKFSTSKILAMEFCEGLKLNDWIKTETTYANKLKLSEKMLDLFMLEFLTWKIVQTDPNFGNFLVQTEPLKVVLLDFGSSLRFSDEFIYEYLETIRITASGAKEDVYNQAIKFKLLDPRESNEAKEAFYNMMQVSMEPFLSNAQPFDFTSVDYEKRAKESVLNFSRKLRYSPPPRKIIFLHRKLGGLFNLLRKLEVKIDLRPYWQTLMAKGEKI